MTLFFRILAVLGIVWFINSEEGQKLIAPFIESINLNTDISQYECSDVVKLVKGEELQNAFGGRFKIIFVNDVELISKNEEKIICSGNLKLSNGTNQTMELSVTKTAENEIYYEVTP
tara:strand:- start:1329 stop:1679 length:351 start_codon:yes stop_codon:yes gene_type:complete